ncbi:MAG: hypothetical protein WC119_02010 [Synergistaceae bacterium]
MNNWWEDMDMNEELKSFHDEVVREMEIPDWAVIICPYCGEKLSERSVRSISLLFNARNIGDVAVEFCCDKCKKMDTVYFIKASQNIRDFIDLLDPCYIHDRPEDEPILEGKMYALQYNNLVERRLLERQLRKGD